MHRKEGFENRDLGSGKERGKVAIRLKRGKEGKEKEWKREKRGYKREKRGRSLDWKEYGPHPLTDSNTPSVFHFQIQMPCQKRNWLSDNRVRNWHISFQHFSITIIKFLQVLFNNTNICDNWNDVNTDHKKALHNGTVITVPHCLRRTFHMQSHKAPWHQLVIPPACQNAGNRNRQQWLLLQ